MSFDCNFKPFDKPEGWNELALYEKIAVYGQHLTTDHAKYVDKLQAKKIVKEKLGSAIEVARVVRVLGDWKDLRPEDLKTCYLIKSTHASGWNINITDTTDLLIAKYQLRQWNKIFRPSLSGEVQYCFLTPQFFIEEKIEDPITGKGGKCLAYMFRYIHNTIVSIGVQLDGKCNHYDQDWNLILEPELSFHIPKPDRLLDMLSMSQTLAQGFEFVRIDMFIDNNDKIYFSEFTFTPKAGKPVFPLHLEIEYGKLWT